MDKPVAWLEPEWGEKICPEVGYEVTMTDDHPRDLCWIPLYPHPPQPAQEPWRESASDYERGVIDGRQMQAQSSVDKAVNRMAQPVQERNFCSRCGKRTADLTVIHTCTPPQEKNA